MFKAIMKGMFGDGRASARRNAASETPENVNTPQPSTARPTTFGYHFGSVGVQRNPGPAYHSPLQRFQPYIPNVWEGWGGKAVISAQQKGTQFAAFEPLTVVQQLQPVITGGTGTITGGFYGAPLIDTNPNAVG
jgi:hypothetical protein